MPPEVERFLQQVGDTVKAPIRRSIENRYKRYKTWKGDFQKLEELEKEIGDQARSELAGALPKKLLAEMSAEIQEAAAKLGRHKVRRSP